MDRQSHWEQIYQTKNADQVSWFEPRPETSLGLIQRSAVARSAAIIDIGSGTSRLLDTLIEAGYNNLSALDIAPAALAQSRQRLGVAAQGIDWIAADITEATLPKTYDLWHDRAVFHFLTQTKDQQAYRRQLLRYLKPGGTLIIASFALDGPRQCSGLDVQRYDAQGLSTFLGAPFQRLESLSETHSTPSGAQQAFIYNRFIRRTDAHEKE